jgi:peptidoglycan-N-acetylmuramic acid deacetylase
MPSPTIVSAPERLDYAALDRADGTKLEWGVRSNGRDTPGITDAQRAVLDKYNAHFMGDPSRKKIHFLFSTGYEAGYTGLILDTLKKHDIKALFFLVGDYVELEPDLVRRMLDEGHEMGNHSFRHSTLPYADNAKLQYEILDYDKYFRSIYGRGFHYFMPPSGVYSEKVLEAARQMGYTTLFWSFAYWDFDIKNQQGADYAYNNIMGSIHNGEFLFLHTVSSANAYALDRVITDLKLMG